MWLSKTKQDLIIEVWEKLDCESVGKEEIEAIEIVVGEQFGESAVESPMIVARRLADEGAVLRHPEILALYIKRRRESPYDPMFRNILKISTFDQTLSSIRNLENLRKKFLGDGDKKGLNLVRKTALEGKKRSADIAGSDKREPAERMLNGEIAEWLAIWLQTPDVFEDWVELRQASKGFKSKFENRRKT